MNLRCLALHLNNQNENNKFQINYITQQEISMSYHKPSQSSKKQQSASFNHQIVQNYPANPFIEPFLDENSRKGSQIDIFESLMRENSIVESFSQQPGRNNLETILNPQKTVHMGEMQDMWYDGSGIHSPHPAYQGFRKGQIEEQIDAEYELQAGLIEHKYYSPHRTVSTPSKAHRSEQERFEKVSKIQKSGCNCRKSKCLKMYCQCFHLQTYCSQNCNCVGCGNVEPTNMHQQAVIDALTRNPKAFEEEIPKNMGSFNLGVELTTVKKGCKCKKTKCIKKYCECYNSNTPCGIFCKCQGCENC